MSSQGSRTRPGDLFLCLALLTGTIAYLVHRPHDLDPADEALFLYEAKRILAGDLFYRDIFEIITPGGQYFVALCFALFGATMTTARTAMACVHGATTMVIFCACRTLRCSKPLSLAAAAAYVALCQPAWPYASAHWVSTLLVTTLFLVALRRPWRRSARWAVVPGVLVGLLIMVQQQKGMVFALTLLPLLALERALDPRESTPRIGLPAVFAHYALGVAAVVVPCFAGLILSGGVAPVWRALVEQPLFKYRVMNRPPSWGWIGLFNRHLLPYTSVEILKLLPAVLVLDAARGAAAWLRDRRVAEIWRHLVIVLTGVASIASILYFPDFIHLAFIAPVFLVALAESVEWGARNLAHLWRPLALSGPLLAAVLLAGIGLHLHRNLLRGRADYPFAFQSEFGRIDVASGERVEQYERVRELVQNTETKEIFCYPVFPALYLVTPARNPTPYQVLYPDYNFPAQLQHAIDVLERRKVPLVVLVERFLKPGDPVVEYVLEHYEPVAGSDLVYRRRPPPDTLRSG
jgi:hypothetical protein